MVLLLTALLLSVKLLSVKLVVSLKISTNVTELCKCIPLESARSMIKKWDLTGNGSYRLARLLKSEYFDFQRLYNKQQESRHRMQLLVKLVEHPELHDTLFDIRKLQSHRVLGGMILEHVQKYKGTIARSGFNPSKFSLHHRHLLMSRIEQNFPHSVQDVSWQKQLLADLSRAERLKLLAAHFSIMDLKMLLEMPFLVLFKRFKNGSKLFANELMKQGQEMGAVKLLKLVLFARQLSKEQSPIITPVISKASETFSDSNTLVFDVVQAIVIWLSSLNQDVDLNRLWTTLDELSLKLPTVKSFVLDGQVELLQSLDSEVLIAESLVEKVQSVIREASNGSLSPYRCRQFIQTLYYLPESAIKTQYWSLVMGLELIHPDYTPNQHLYIEWVLRNRRLQDSYKMVLSNDDIAEDDSLTILAYCIADHTVFLNYRLPETFQSILPLELMIGFVDNVYPTWFRCEDNRKCCWLRNRNPSRFYFLSKCMLYYLALGYRMDLSPFPEATIPWDTSSDEDFFIHSFRQRMCKGEEESTIMDEAEQMANFIFLGLKVPIMELGWSEIHYRLSDAPV